MEFLARSIDIEFLICIHTFQYPITVIFGPVTEFKYIFEIIKIIWFLAYYQYYENVVFVLMYQYLKKRSERSELHTTKT